MVLQFYADLEILAQRNPTMAQMTPSPRWSPQDCQRVKDILTEIARKVCTKRQFDIFEMVYLDEMSMNQTGKTLGIPYQSVAQAINGNYKKKGGMMKKIRKEIETNVELSEAIEDIEAKHEAMQAPQPVGTQQLVLNWFKSIRYPAKVQTHFLPYITLMYIYFLKDAKDTLTMTELLQHLPSSVVNQSMQPLRSLGLALVDGNLIRFIKLPADIKTMETINA